jgi:hypothetical protein
MAENEQKTESTIQEVTVDGYVFKVDTDLLDDVEAFEYSDRIENKGQVAAIAPLLTFMIGVNGYNAMKAHFAKTDADEHKDTLDYKGRFRIKKLNEVYLAIIEKFNPKG